MIAPSQILRSILYWVLTNGARVAPKGVFQSWKPAIKSVQSICCLVSEFGNNNDTLVLKITKTDEDISAMTVGRKQ